jgi:hypothetical protein
MTIHFDTIWIFVFYLVGPMAGSMLGRWISTRWLFWRTGRKLERAMLDKKLR